MPPFTDPASLERAHAVLVRHGETTYNTKELLNGNPGLPVPLSALGKAQAITLRPLFEAVPWRRLYTTRFGRTRETLDLLLPGHELAADVLPELDDIDVGEFEGRARKEYREWRHDHGVGEAPERGESRLNAVARYAQGLARLAGEDAGPILVVTHDQPIRYLENALQGEDPVFGPVGPIPNAVPFPYSRAELVRGATALSQHAARAAQEA